MSIAREGDDSRKNAIFTDALLQTLRTGKAQDTNGNVTVQSLYRQVRKVVMDGKQQSQLISYGRLRGQIY